MEFKKGLQFLYVLTILFLYVSCDSSNSPPAFQDNRDTNSNACKARISQAYVQNLTSELESIEREAESYLHSISDEFPEFGGIYLDKNGDYNILLTDTKAQENFKIIFENLHLKSSKTEADKLRTKIRKAEFTFRDLAVWRELVTALLLAGHEYPYVISSHIDHIKNRVIIGIEYHNWNDINLQKVKTFIDQTLKIPAEAILYNKEFVGLSESEDIFENLSGDYFSRQRPVLGGLRIGYGSSNCSLGFLGVYENEEVFITNGHCTNNPHGRSGTLYYQGERGKPNDVIGSEVADGPQTLDKCITANSDCWPCRWSDSAIVELRDNVNRARGFITKTDWKSEEWMVEGSRQINEDDPVFTIVDLQDEILTGMTLHKVGGNSGWTSGEVIKTCVDSRRNRHEMILLCQYRAKYATSGGGTSGSPVFKRLEDEYDNIQNPIALVGIHRASSNRSDPGGYSAFSPISGVLKDFEKLKGITFNFQ